LETLDSVGKDEFKLSRLSLTCGLIFVK